MHVEAELVLGTRDGESVRGGDAGTLPSDNPSSKAALDALIDAAVTNVAAAHGVSVSLGSGDAAGGGGVVDSAALDAYADTVTGPEGVLAATARTILDQLGHLTPEPAEPETSDTALIDAVEAELDPQWFKMVTPTFDEQRAVLSTTGWHAREDLARLANGADIAVQRFAGTGEVVAKQAAWWAGQTSDKKLAQTLTSVSEIATQEPTEPWVEDVALVTGAAPGSIAGALVEKLLAGGATVIMTASNVNDARKEYARTLYANNASAHAKLWLVPANMSSFRDVDSLVEWIGTEQKVTVGKDVKVTKPALTPTLVFPLRPHPACPAAWPMPAPLQKTRRACCCGVWNAPSPVSLTLPPEVLVPACTWCCPVPRTAAPSAAMAPTAKSRQPSMPSWRNGPLKASGRTTCPSPRPASAGWLVPT